MAKAPQEMTDGELRRAYASQSKQNIKVCNKLIAAGRGNETYEETMKASDPLAKQYQKGSVRTGELVDAAKRRWGPAWQRLL